MAIDESQLTTWSGLGSVAQSRDTYAAIKPVLEASNAPYASPKIKTYLQGSYGNDTNIRGDSDVDIVIVLKSVWYGDVTRLPPDQQAAYNSAMSKGSLTQAQFKTSVAGWLGQHFAGVNQCNKAIRVPAGGKRRKADVLAACQRRRYHRYVNDQDQFFEEGVAFHYGGKLIENFPEYHSANCTNKHKNTHEWFKPTVRIFKNLRTHMVENGYLVDGAAPSYFVEGLIYNVPDPLFGSNFVTTCGNCLDWVIQADQQQLKCASEKHWLVRDNKFTSWPTQDFQAFVGAAKHVWDTW